MSVFNFIGVELWGVYNIYHGLRIAVTLGFTRIIVESASKVPIHLQVITTSFNFMQVLIVKL